MRLCVFGDGYYLTFSSLCLILGAISSISDPTVLEYLPNQNTSFSCFGRENDREAGLTFAINNNVYGLNDLGPFVQFIHQLRTGQGDQLNITTTLVISDGANGSILWCCYVDGTQIFRRESFLLCLCHTQMETTTMPASAVTNDHGSLTVTTGVSISNTTDDSLPSLVSGGAIEKLTAGTIPAVVLVLALCGGAVLLTVYCRYRFVKNKAKNSPSKEVKTETEERLVSSPSTSSEGTDHRKTRFPGYAVVRSDLESVLSPVRNDDVPPMVTAVFGRCEKRVVNVEAHPELTNCTSESEDPSIETLRLIVNPNNPNGYYIQEKSLEVHGIALPQNKAPALLGNANMS